MFDIITPEQAGISSKNVADFIKLLEKCDFNTHGVLLMKGNHIFSEYYWAPFDKNTCHRMYSQTKSFVSVAIGLLEEEGKLCLDDCVYSYFQGRINPNIPELLKRQTIRDMLKMETCGETPSWFDSNEADRTKLYFEQMNATHPSGTIWSYDSAGSQVLSSLVEQLSGKTLLDYLTEKLFSKMGTFQTATVLKTKNGDSWGDSAMICTLRDMASFGRFVMNYGTWNGERLMNEKYLREATSYLVSNSISNISGFNSAFSHGYGYQIWKTEQDGFAFVGMGNQITVCLPKSDLIFTCIADNQGYAASEDVIINALFELIINNMKDTLPADKAAENELCKITAGLRLKTARGRPHTDFEAQVSGQRYKCDNNPMGITEFSLVFDSKDEGVFQYKNAQGEKELRFGIGKNILGKFPQFGYSNEQGGLVSKDGFLYDCASSAAWQEEKKLLLRVQIIDRYLGNLTVIFSFKDDMATVLMKKNAENFLKEYDGMLTGKKE